jgi:hypothetical protein
MLVIAGSGPTESNRTFTSFAEITSPQLLEVELKLGRPAIARMLAEQTRVMIMTRLDDHRIGPGGSLVTQASPGTIGVLSPPTVSGDHDAVFSPRCQVCRHVYFKRSMPVLV